MKLIETLSLIKNMIEIVVFGYFKHPACNLLNQANKLFTHFNIEDEQNWLLKLSEEMSPKSSKSFKMVRYIAMISLLAIS